MGLKLCFLLNLIKLLMKHKIWKAKVLRTCGKNGFKMSLQNKNVACCEYVCVHVYTYSQTVQYFPLKKNNHRLSVGLLQNYSLFLYRRYLMFCFCLSTLKYAFLKDFFCLEVIHVLDHCIWITSRLWRKNRGNLV